MAELSIWILLLLLTAAFCAGCVDAAVGGGGLIQLPAFLLVFPSPSLVITALATNKLASSCGTVTSAITFSRRVVLRRRAAAALVAAAGCGGLAGATLAQYVTKQTVYPLLIAAMAAILAYTVARPRLGAEDRDLDLQRFGWATLVLIGCAIGIYDGVLGPGTGTFLVISLVTFLHCDFLRGTAYAKFANAATNLGALALFVPLGVIHWPLGLMMGAANLAGGYVGTRIVIAGGRALVRKIFVVVLTVLMCTLTWQFFRG